MPIRNPGQRLTGTASVLLFIGLALSGPLRAGGATPALADAFLRPPDSARPWVYWMWMDGNLSREGITADLEAMRRAGIGGVIIMEVDVGIPKGPVKFMSPAWRELFKHVASEAARLGLEIDLNASPGWTGSGGPWVKPEQSMQKVVFSETTVPGPQRFEGSLAQPPTQEGFYRDIAVLAIPKQAGSFRIRDILEKALYTRGHFSSESGVKAFLPAPAQYPAVPPDETVPLDGIVDLTAQLDPAGRLTWDVPAGQWTVIRFGRTSTGANTRPAPQPGLGLECDKLDPAALDAHFDAYLGTLMADIGELTGKSLTSLHIDSWEMGPQNWTARFREEFQRRRGYDPLLYLPVMTGRVVASLEVSERFLWDLRQTVSNLIVENHARHLHALAQRRGLRLAIEPYDGTPCDDLTYGAVADVPMCEFWANCFETWFSCTEATSIAHTYGRQVVAAEAFTSDDKERWLLHPGAMKVLGDWAFCQGINRFVFHRYAHQPWLDRWPGMTMGPYGIHYERTQTWWDMVPAYNTYLARCQYMLQRGLSVADVCCLAPEGAPHVFSPPRSATRGNPPDRLGYNFDACTPEALLTRVSVKDGRVVLPDGMNYRLLILPQIERMTPRLLRKISELVQAGATVLGNPPQKSPSLGDYPACDEQVKQIARELWGSATPAAALTERTYGRGRVIWTGQQAGSGAAEERAANPLAKARWIWHKEGNPAVVAPVGTRYFRRVIKLDADHSLESARLAMTADNGFELRVNGQPVGAGGNFNRVFLFDVTALLKPGTNLLAVAAENGGDTPNPAGLIGALELKFKGGEILEVYTDRNWQSASSASPNWTSDVASTDGWGAALELGTYGMPPWGTPATTAPRPDIYCDFGLTSRVLAQMGVPPDFESDAELRYTHRRDGDTDIYFVANPADHWVATRCAFRVSGKGAELWDPLTGRISQPLIAQESDGRTFVPLWLEPAGSVFVIFKPGTSRAESDRFIAIDFNGQNMLPQAGQAISQPPLIEAPGGASQSRGLLAWRAGVYHLETVSRELHKITVPELPSFELSGTWEVQFQAKRGAPERLTFDALMDWSKHSDPGVQHFSGIATYRKEFTAPADLTARKRRVFLGLGRVQVMARVTLNGRDIGIVWKTPYRLDITEAVRAGANSLEIQVANLWPNRLIGDAGSPPEKRVAWTTWNPFTKDTPLLESGLLGPVKICAAEVIAEGLGSGSAAPKLQSMRYSHRNAAQAVAWQREVRQQLQTVLKLDDFSSSLPLDPKLLSSDDKAAYIYREIELRSTPQRTFKAILTLPRTGRTPYPAVVCIHGHGGSRNVVYDTKSIYKGFAAVLAETDYVTIATDVGQHEVYEPGQTLMGERLWDLMRCVDYLQTLKEVDRRRIGCAGLSLGGEMAMWLGAMDERIAATVSSGFLTSMDQMEQNHCMCWKLPGLRELVDYADIYSLTAPRALQCQNGLGEPRGGFIVPLAREAMGEIKLIYADLGEPESAELAVHREGHVIDLPALTSFLQKHLAAQ